MIGLWSLAALASAPTQHQAPPVVSPPPIVRMQSEQYGDWEVSYISDGFYAAQTTNSAGSVLGSLCSQSGCFSFINPQIACEDKAKYPSLLNAPGGAFDETLTCAVITQRNLLIFSDEGPIVDSMSIGGLIGVAVPMASGEFAVSRYSLTGAARAYARASQLAGYRSSQQGPSDSRL